MAVVLCRSPGCAASLPGGQRQGLVDSAAASDLVLAAPGKVNNSEPVAAYDIDGFENSAAEVAALHAQGKHVICYIDVGTAEDFRPDYSRVPRVGARAHQRLAGRAMAGHPPAEQCSSRS